MPIFPHIEKYKLTNKINCNFSFMYTTYVFMHLFLFAVVCRYMSFSLLAFKIIITKEYNKNVNIILNLYHILNNFPQHFTKHICNLCKLLSLHENLM